MHRQTSDFEISFFEKLVSLKPNYVDALIPLAEAYTRRGFYAKGLEVDERLVKLRKDDPTVRYNLACSLALSGRKEEAIQTLECAITLGYNEFDHMRRDPDLKSLHGNSQFEALFSPEPKRKSKKSGN